MFKKQQLVAFSLAVLALFGCVNPAKHLTPEQVKAQEEMKEKMAKASFYRERLDRVNELMVEGKLTEAEIYFAPLEKADFASLRLPFFQEEVEMLRRSLDKAKALKPLDGANKIVANSMLNEVDGKLALPETYGKSVVIDANLPPMEMPVGTMEKTLNGNVSISLDNAGIAELVGALRNTCKLNVIADDALQSDKTLTIAVEKVPLKEVLSYISRNMGIAFHLGENILWITHSATSEGGPQLQTRIIRLRQGTIPTVPQGGPGAPGAEQGGIGTVEYKEDNELDEALTTFMADSPEGASFKIFKDRNILVVRDTFENLRLIEDLVRELDKPPYQVVIEARFITVSQDDLRDLGAEIKQVSPVGEYPDQTDKNSLKTINMLSSLGALTAGSEQGVGLINFSGVLGNHTYDILISALDKKASTVTLSVPRVTVMNNREARVRKGEKLYYFEEYDVESVDNGDDSTSDLLVPTGKPVELPVGLTFDVKVNVGNDGRTVLLGLKPEIVEFKGWETYMTASSDDDDDDDDDDGDTTELTPIKLPRTYEQSVITTVGVASGNTVVLGGMLEKKKTKTVKKVPLLGDIPIIRYLFRHEEVTDVPLNLLIFVTATVINDHGEFVTVQPEK